MQISKLCNYVSKYDYEKETTLEMQEEVGSGRNESSSKSKKDSPRK